MKHMKIDIIGKGNVASHLLNAFTIAEADVRCVNSRTFEGLRNDSDIYLISVSDDAIYEVACYLSKNISSNSIMAHTSGTTPMCIFKSLHNHIGVFYPLQTFTKGVKLDYSIIPLLLEANDEYSKNKLKDLAILINDNYHFIDSDKRKDLHIASVFSCNFVNHLWSLAYDYLNTKGLNFDLIKPLIRETTLKIERLSPHEAQTGPASRHDKKTMNMHLNRLDENKELCEIYSILSESIINHCKKLK